MADEQFQTVRALGGLLGIIVLLSMIFLNFWDPDLTLTWEGVVILVSLISALLGIDIAKYWRSRWHADAHTRTHDDDKR